MKKLLFQNAPLLLCLVLASNAAHAQVSGPMQSKLNAVLANKNTEELNALAAILMTFAQPLVLDIAKSTLTTFAKTEGKEELGIWVEKAQQLGGQSFEIAGKYLLMNDNESERFPALSSFALSFADELEKIEGAENKLASLESMYKQVMNSYAEGQEPESLTDTLYPESSEESEEGSLEVESAQPESEA